MQGVRKAMGVFLMFFGIVTFTSLLIMIGSDMQTYADLEIDIGLREIFSYVSLLGLSVAEFVLGFELSGLLTKEPNILAKPKPSDKGVNILLYGIGAIAIGFIVFFFVLMLILPNL